MEADSISCSVEVCVLLTSLVAGLDYIALSVPDRIVFQLNSTEGMEMCTAIEILEDESLEGRHNFTVSISSADVSRGIPVEALVVIEDNERRFDQTSGQALDDKFLHHIQVSHWDLLKKFRMPWRTSQ